MNGGKLPAHVSSLILGLVILISNKTKKLE